MMKAILLLTACLCGPLFPLYAALPEISETPEHFQIQTQTKTTLLVNKKNGVLQLPVFEGIALRAAIGQSPEILAPVFSIRQMETEGVLLDWTSRLEKNDEEVIVVQTTLLQESAAGIDLAGVRLTRKVVVSNKSAGLRCNLLLENTTENKRYRYLGFRNQVIVSANGQDFNYIPSADCVLEIGSGAFWEYYTRISPWQQDVTAGWMALNNRATKQGIAYLFDYNTVDGMYAAELASVHGWMMDAGAFPAGTQYTVNIVIMPVKGLSNICHASKQYTAGLAGSGKDVALEAYAPNAEIPLKGQISVRTFDRKPIQTEEFEIALQPGKTGKYAFLLEQEPSCQTVIEVKTGEETFEQYRENGYRTRPIPMQPPVFLAPRTPPPRTQENEEMVSLFKPRDRKALILFGLYTNYNRFEQILKDWQIQTIPAILEGIKTPPPASTIDEYALIILGNVNKESMRGILSRLRSYVNSGGVLLITGGPLAYGCGGYQDTILDPMLPLQCAPFDLRPAAGDGHFDEPLPMISSDGKKHAAEVLWLHKNQLRGQPAVMLRAGTLPLLVKSTYGKGKILCFLGAPMGNPKPHSHPYWESTEYIDLMKGIIDQTVREVKQ